jgi:uncharacterized protein (TIGR02001 family)
MAQFILFSFMFLFIAFSAKAQQLPKEVSSSKIAGDAELMSNFVERGVSQSDRDPALNAGFWFNFGPQFRAGIGGVNVGYEGSESRFRLMYNADIKISFSDRTDLIIYFGNHNYFKPESRNGWLYGLNLRLFEVWKISYVTLTNWEGTGKPVNYFAGTYEYSLSERWKMPTQLGYSTISEIENYNSYFDLRTGAHFQQNGSLRYKIDLTYNSSAAQFNQRAGIFLILGAQLSI